MATARRFRGRTNSSAYSKAFDDLHIAFLAGHLWPGQSVIRSFASRRALCTAWHTPAHALCYAWYTPSIFLLLSIARLVLSLLPSRGLAHASLPYPKLAPPVVPISRPAHILISNVWQALSLHTIFQPELGSYSVRHLHPVCSLTVPMVKVPEAQCIRGTRSQISKKLWMSPCSPWPRPRTTPHNRWPPPRTALLPCNRCRVVDLCCNCEACSLDAPGVVTPDTAPDISDPT